MAASQHQQQLIPVAELAPPGIGHLSPDQRVSLWAQMVDEGDRLLFEAFVRSAENEQAARQAMLAWLERRDADSTAAKIRMLQSRPPREHTHGR